MPTYAYRCDTCSHEFDIFQRFSDDALRDCAECGATIRRVIQPVGVVFKGSGWYITDNRASSHRDESSSSKSDKSDGTDGAEKKADAEKKGGTDKAEPAETKKTTEKAAEATSSGAASKPAAD